MICKVWSISSRIKTPSLLELIRTSNNEVLKDFESHLAVGISKLAHSTWNTAESNVAVEQTAGS
jgi:hypothetical protein